MNRKVKSKIKRFAKALEDANKNHKILCGRPSEEEREECVKRMALLEKAETELESLKSETNLPVELSKYFNANDDAGCDQCWISSSGAIHQECGKKIKRWFSCREKVLRLGLSLSKGLK